MLFIFKKLKFPVSVVLPNYVFDIRESDIRISEYSDKFRDIHC